MPPQRYPLGLSSGNRLPSHELSPYTRGQIIGYHKAGAAPLEIALSLNEQPRTILTTIHKESLRNEGESQPRTPRGKSYTDTDVRHILRVVRAEPKSTYAQVKLACGLTCSTSTLKRILKEYGITNWRAKRRPELSPAHAAARLTWCIKRKDWNKETWGMVMWSDECSVERGRGKEQEWVFRTPAQKWQRAYVQTYKAGKDISIMVWACFWDRGRSDLYILDRDFESKKHGYSANSYLSVLND
jgi:hypothetical protein